MISRWNVKFIDGAFSDLSGLGTDPNRCRILNSPTKARAVAGEFFDPGF
jgi:hypothetical protein